MLRWQKTNDRLWEASLAVCNMPQPIHDQIYQPNLVCASQNQQCHSQRSWGCQPLTSRSKNPQTYKNHHQKYSPPWCQVCIFFWCLFCQSCQFAIAKRMFNLSLIQTHRWMASQRDWSTSVVFPKDCQSGWEHLSIRNLCTERVGRPFVLA